MTVVMVTVVMVTVVMVRAVMVKGVMVTVVMVTAVMVTAVMTIGVLVCMLTKQRCCRSLHIAVEGIDVLYVQGCHYFPLSQHRRADPWG